MVPLPRLQQQRARRRKKVKPRECGFIARKERDDTILSMKAETQEASPTRSIVGTVHRFGKNGVLYEVLREVDDTSVMIRVLDTNEETRYSITDVQKDPTN